MERTKAEVMVVGVGIILIALLVAGLLTAMETTTYDMWAGILVFPILVLISLPALGRQAAREGDRQVFWFLVFALVVKLCGSLARMYVVYKVYGRWNDAGQYHEWGVRLAAQFRAGDFHTGLHSLTGTDFIRFLPGLVYTVIGPTRLGGFFVFSWLGFWGLFCFYRAFTVAVPEGRARTYARFLFFLPSFIYWPSSIGKDAWEIFALGIGALGTAHLLSGKTSRGVLLAVIGVWMAALVRMHIATILAAAMAGAYLLQSLRNRSPRRSTLAVRIVTLTALFVLVAILVPRMQQYLQEKQISTTGGVTTALREVAASTGQGGSEFTASILESPAAAPAAAFTVLFRPLPQEAHNTQALLSALEGSFLLLVCVVRMRWILAALRTFRRRGYVTFALLYTGLFIVGFSGIANFGILTRQRVQLLPLFLVMLAIPARNGEEEPVQSEALAPLGMSAEEEAAGRRW